MAFTFSVNQTPSTAPVAIYTLISTLIAAGWTKTRDSDGTTYSSTGAQVTSGNIGTNGLANNNAWIVIKAPTVGSNARSFCFQRHSNGNQYWRVKYSANAGFTGGSPSGTQTPFATDEVIICGSGTDASPNGTFWFAADGSYRWHVIAGGALDFYSFTAFSLQTATPAAQKIIFLDVLATGSFSPSDPDPAVFGMSSSTPFAEIINSNNNTSDPKPAYGWLGATNNINNAVNMQLASFGGVTVSNSFGYGVNPFSNKDVAFPIFWLRTSTQSVPIGPKGLSSLFKGNSTFRTNMDVFNLVGTRDSVYFQTVQIPWDGSIPIV